MVGYRLLFGFVVVTSYVWRAHGLRKLSPEENAELKRTCGIPSNVSAPAVHANAPDASYKIYGGRVVGDGKMPWAVKIVDKFTGQCSGTLISRWHIMTAAHCLFQAGDGDMYMNGFESLDALSTYVVYGGSPCLEEVINDTVRGFTMIGLPLRGCTPGHRKRGQLLRVKGVILPQSSLDYVQKHVMFFGRQVADKGAYFYSDIAIFELDQPIGADDVDFRPACIPQKLLVPFPSNISLLAFGYGDSHLRSIASRSFPIMSTELFSVLAVGNRTECDSENSATSRFGCDGHLIVHPMFPKNESACHGDSGGGLVAELGDRFNLLGVCSAGTRGCYFENLANDLYEELMYSRMDVHIDFICHNTGICPLNYVVNKTVLEKAIEIDANFRLPLGEGFDDWMTTSSTAPKARSSIGLLNPLPAAAVALIGLYFLIYAICGSLYQ